MNTLMSLSQGLLTALLSSSEATAAMSPSLLCQATLDPKHNEDAFRLEDKRATTTT
jgi:hypothetical protein